MADLATERVLLHEVQELLTLSPPTDSHELDDSSEGFLPAVYVKDTECQFMEVNATAARRLGVSHDPAIATGKTNREFFSEEYSNAAEAIEAEVIEGGQADIDRLERQTMLTDGGERWLLTTRLPRRDADGDVSGVFVISRDITIAAIQAESALAQIQQHGEALFGKSATPLETLARSRRAVAGANDGMWDREMSTNRLSVSKRWLEILGIERPLDLKFDNLVEMIHPDDRDRMKAANEAHLKGRTPTYECEFRIRHRDGSYRWIHSRGKVTRDTDGKAIFFSGSHTDITSRKEAQRRLAENARFVERLVDTDRSMIFVKNRDHEFTFVNEALATFYGRSKTQILGNTDEEFSATEEQCARFRRDDTEILEGRETEIVQIEDIRGDDGKTYWFRTTKVPFEIDGETHVLGVAIDMTTWYHEREKHEQQRDALRTIMELCPIALHLKRLDGTYEIVNEAFLSKAEKQSFREVVGKTVHEVFSKEIAEKVVESDQRILNGVQEVHSEMQIGERLYDVVKLPRTDGRGKVIGILGVSREITSDNDE